IATLAYQFSRTAPLKTKPADNVLVRLCTIELNRSRPIQHDSLSQSFVKDITDWGKYAITFISGITPSTSTIPFLLFPTCMCCSPTCSSFMRIMSACNSRNPIFRRAMNSLS
ncbi:MAG: DUF4838 domain-containing protein, partial [Bacteroidetes bacterium]|nr:DUF4838 domain-containing protein [Bacteroidota bacterium]